MLSLSGFYPNSSNGANLEFVSEFSRIVAASLMHILPERGFSLPISYQLLLFETAAT